MVSVREQSKSVPTTMKATDRNPLRIQFGWGRRSVLAPNLNWRGYIRNLGRGVEFSQALTDDRLAFAETGHEVRKRMINWITQCLNQDQLNNQNNNNQ